MKKMDNTNVTFSDIAQAYLRISPYINKTPVVTCSQADAKSRRKLFFKCENQQKTGSFKARGALNAILHPKEESNKVSGFTTFSSGNHAQALSWACSVGNFPCYAVVPERAPQAKKDAIRGYGANLIVSSRDPNDGKKMVARLELEKGVRNISSNNHQDVIAGQGTTVLEFLEQVPQLDAIFVPMAGGGLAAGTCIAAKELKPDIKIYLVSPKGKRLDEYIKTGRRPWNGPGTYLDTVADGLRLQQTGFIASSIFLELAEKQVFEMADEDIVAAMKFIFERMKLVVEPSGAAPLAAVFSNKFQAMDPNMVNIGVILTGGNADIYHLPWLH